MLGAELLGAEVLGAELAGAELLGASLLGAEVLGAVVGDGAVVAGASASLLESLCVEVLEGIDWGETDPLPKESVEYRSPTSFM